MDVHVSVRSYLSWHHLEAAKESARQAKEAEGRPESRPFEIKHRGHVLQAVLSSVAFLEAAINEFWKDVAESHGRNAACVTAASRETLGYLWGRFEEVGSSKFSILDKYQLVLQVAGVGKFETGEQPYQDADLLIKLRNELMHYKPRSSSRENDHSITKRLHRKFKPNPLMDPSVGNPWFPDKCLGSPCAEWSVLTARNLADAFFSRAGVKANYQANEGRDG